MTPLAIFGVLGDEVSAIVDVGDVGGDPGPPGGRTDPFADEVIADPLDLRRGGEQVVSFEHIEFALTGSKLGGGVRCRLVGGLRLMLQCGACAGERRRIGSVGPDDCHEVVEAFEGGELVSVAGAFVGCSLQGGVGFFELSFVVLLARLSALDLAVQGGDAALCTALLFLCFGDSSLPTDPGVACGLGRFDVPAGPQRIERDRRGGDQLVDRRQVRGRRCVSHDLRRPRALRGLALLRGLFRVLGVSELGLDQVPVLGRKTRRAFADGVA